MIFIKFIENILTSTTPNRNTITIKKLKLLMVWSRGRTEGALYMLFSGFAEASDGNNYDM